VALHPTQSQQTHALLERSLALLRSTDDTNTRMDAMISLGILRMASGAHVEARQAIREALDLGTAAADQWSVATCTFLMGAIDHAQGDYAQAEKSFRQSLAAWREMGESTGRIFCLVSYGDTLIVLGRFAEAQAVLREALEISQSLGDRYGAAVSLDGLGRLALAQGELAEAQNRLRNGMALFEQMGLRYFVVRAQIALGDAASALGEEAGAWRNYREALGEAMEAQLVPTALDVLVRLAGLLARVGALDRALELSLQILKHPFAMKETKDQTEQVRAGLVSQLTPQRIEAAQARACAKSFEAIVQETLSAG
jgi:tetratricopeptide (TPR) repeat protein